VTATATPRRTRPATATGAVTSSAASGSGAASRRRHNHTTHSPNDTASATSAATNSPCMNPRGRTPAAATVSTTPCTAVTTLRHRRAGNGARNHGHTHSPTKNR